MFRSEDASDDGHTKNWSRYLHQALHGDRADNVMAAARRLHKSSSRGHDPSVLMHNDAVVQGLSEAPFMKEVEHWGVMTIGTGLSNARFTNRR
jgi:hypothetical protein